MDKQDLLLEIGCEELPTRSVELLSQELRTRVSKELATRLWGLLNLHQLPTGPIEIFATPRRIAVRITEVPVQQSAQIIERQGPAYSQAFDVNGHPTPAALGFAKSCGVDVAALSIKEHRLYFKGEKPGEKTRDLLPEIARLAISQMTIAKPMRWGNHAEHFARPIHWILFLFGKEIVNTTLFGIPTGNQTLGHRFHHPAPLTISSPKDYADDLKTEGYVLADFSERLEKIRRVIAEVTPPGLQAEIDDDLLKEVTSLVEWPVALAGRFDPEFLTVPPEVLMTSMKVNQKYFPVLDQQGQLQPLFVMISNIEGKDPAVIVHGNERVLNARLTDAAFFYKNDCERSLDSRLPHLEHVIFQKQLGSLADKTARMVILADRIAKQLNQDPRLAKQAAQLSKCDLLSEMVNEFPTLQGIMGYYYAKNDGLSEECALAIKEHYYPRFSGDALPSSMVGNMVALADRLDSLIGIFGINQPPTGDKDPFGLRRAALGIIRILIEKNLPLDLEHLLQHAYRAYTTHLPNNEAVAQVFDFILSRLKSWYLEKGVSAEVIEAVLARRPTQPLDFDQRIRAVQQFQTLPAAGALAAANKRVSNILKKQAGEPWPTKLDPHLFEHAAERVLADQLTQQTDLVNQLYAAGNYAEALQQLSSLKEPVDLFFDKVMVMVDDPAKRNNRLALLAALHHLFTQVADISLL